MHEACSTHERAFVEYGVPTGGDLVGAMHYRLRNRGTTEAASTPDFLDALAKSFEDAYIDEASIPIVPEPVAAAIDDARTTYAHRLLDEPDADRDLRTDVLPAFYRLVARYYCENRETYPGDGVGVWFDSGDGP
ncbi:MAG: hypothetical protein ACI91T_002974 [Natronomonas sp.]|jgi:hypothetical protein